MPTLTLDATIETTRLPELPLFSAYGPLTTADQVMVHLAAFNQTCRLPMQDLYDFVQSGAGGGSSVSDPVVLGDKMLIEVGVDVDPGGTVVSIPQIAGQNFFLERDGYPMTRAEYQVLDAGGFKLIKADPVTGDSDILVDKQRYVLTLYSLQAGGGTVGGGTTPAAATLFKGAVDIATNTTFDTVNHVGKLLGFRSGATQVTLTLPSLSDIPANTIIVVESLINTTVENNVVTSGGQYIYLLGDSRTALYLRPGEVLWLHRKEDGFYVINDFDRHYTEIGKPVAAFKSGLNELVLKGQSVKKSDYPRLWAEVQTFGPSLVSKATYDSDPETYRGCWVDVDSTYLQLPNLLEMFLRGVKSETGTDPERTYNHPGGYQSDSIGAHSHDTLSGLIGTNGSGTVKTRGIYNGSGTGATDLTAATGGTQTRPENVGVLWVTKC